MEGVIENGRCDSALTRHVKSLEVDTDFLDSMKASMQKACDSDIIDSADEFQAMLKDNLPVYWRCRHNTMTKVASLPHFDTLLKEYHTGIYNNTKAIEIEVSVE